jgi:uncharacterized protein
MLLVAAPVAAQQFYHSGDPAQVTVSERATVQAPADAASVYVLVEAAAPGASAAALAASDLVRAITDTLVHLGVSRADVLAAENGVNQRPASPYGPPAPSPSPGFVGRTTLAVRVRHLECVNVLAAGAMGAGATSVSAPRLSASALEVAQDTALSHAVERGRRRADAIARGAGMRVGRLLNVWVLPGGWSENPMLYVTPSGQFDASARTPPEVSSSVEVRLTWEIRDSP